MGEVDDIRGPACRLKRRELGLTQSQVAEMIPAKQAQLSLFERQKHGALSEEKIEAYVKLLDDLQSRCGSRGALRPGLTLRVCDNPYCLGHELCVVGEHVHAKPWFVRTDLSFCNLCGEDLRDSCSKCGMPIQAGLACGGCGRQYLERASFGKATGDDLTDLVSRRNEAHQKMRNIARPRVVLRPGKRE